MKSNDISLPTSPFKTRGGVKVPHRKNTSACESIVMDIPSQVSIPMQQHIGAPCKPTVKVGDIVSVGQVIGDSDQFVSAPIHATVSGKVLKIADIQMTNGSKCQAVVIQSDGLQTKCSELQPPKIDTLDEFLSAVRASGLVGLGGAGFPTHVKLRVPKDKNVDTLVVNGAECEPYITTDHREFLENSENVLYAITKIKEMLNLKRVIIGIERNKPDAIELMKKLIEKEGKSDYIAVLALKASYPQGGEKVLIEACTGRVVEMGKLPADAGCVVMNVTSLGKLAEYLKTGMPLVTKRLTVAGSAIKEPKNVIVPIGTMIKDLIEFCGGYSEEPKKILIGGPMMGVALTSDEFFVLKQNNAILAFNEKDAKLMDTTDCIRCGRCVASCPMKLMPPLISRAVKLNDIDELKSLGAMNCMECGCCTFSCPAGKFIVQTMRTAKTMIRTAK